MTTIPNSQDQLARERRSAILMGLLLLISLLIGWQVKTAVQNATRPIALNGFTAAIPNGWLLQEGTGDLLFVARNPQALDQLYRVSRESAGGGLEAMAINRNVARAQLDETYRVLDASPIVFNGQDGYKVSFARADFDSPGMPHIIEGIDYYFVFGDQIAILSLESKADTVADALPYFQKFVQSVSYQAGGE
ncbi:hypothetical protein MNBD_CHLOROFLEXI01-1178 [hydrothermal vent metagenome]|uniref:PsbP C-terminal domain-containing protein n=1 Tax=hydrothermal vent metagenome TaxID=652676 RepID=A0A3B0UWJ3_9ZZZZ